jgi:hypothetical protein
MNERRAGGASAAVVRHLEPGDRAKTRRQQGLAAGLDIAGQQGALAVQGDLDHQGVVIEPEVFSLGLKNPKAGGWIFGAPAHRGFGLSGSP